MIAIEEELQRTLDRIAERYRGVDRDQSNQLTFGDRCYAAGLAYAIGTVTGENKDQVLARFKTGPTVRPPKVIRRRKPSTTSTAGTEARTRTSTTRTSPSRKLKRR